VKSFFVMAYVHIDEYKDLFVPLDSFQARVWWPYLLKPIRMIRTSGAQVLRIKELAHRTTLQVAKEVEVSHSKVAEAATLKIKALAQHEEFHDGEDDTIVKPGLFFALPLVRRNKKAEKSRTFIRPTPPTIPPPLNML
jgi:hypothetical protein